MSKELLNAKSKKTSNHVKMHENDCAANSLTSDMNLAEIFVKILFLLVDQFPNNIYKQF